MGSLRNIVDITIIPYTCDHTNIRDRKPGDAVNLETDILEKYVERYLESHSKVRLASPLSIEGFVQQGF